MSIMQGIGSVGFFSSRAFLPAFITALLLRVGPHIDALKNTGFFQNVTGNPSWFTSDWCLVALGVLAAMEIAATKNADARKLLEEFDHYLKPALAALTFIGVVSTADAQFVQQISLRTPSGAGFFDYLFTLLIAGGTYLLAMSRNALLAVISDADEDDDIGVQKLFSWAEDLWATVGVFFLLVYPLVMLLLIGVVAGLVMLARKYVQWREESSKIGCVSCGEMIYPCAIACPKCAAKVAAPVQVGFLGGSKRAPATDLASHELRLVEKKRCPVCATRLTERRPRQFCLACHHQTMSDPRFAERYMAQVASRLPGVLGVTWLLSLIPIIGLIPGVIYYRMALVAPFRRYLPFGRRFFLKWGVRVLFFFLILLQVVPVLGSLAVPVMALVSFLAYRSSYAGMLDEPAQPSPRPTTGAAVEPSLA